MSRLLPIVSVLMALGFFACTKPVAPTNHENDSAKHPAVKVPESEAQFYHSILTEAYLEHGQRDPAWDAQMLSFLAKWEHHLANETDAQYLGDLKQQADALLKAGCHDALLGMGFVYAYRYYSGNPRSITQLRHSTRRLEKQHYSDYLQYLAWSSLQFHLEKATLREQAYAAAWEAGLRFAQSQPWQGGGRDIFLRMVDRFLLLSEDTVVEWRRADRFLEDILKTPGIEPWMEAYWRGTLTLNKAWSARGEGWADEVRQDQSDRHKALLIEARAYLIEAHRLAPDRPQAAVDMIRLCWGQLDHPDPLQTPQYWFEQATRAQIDARGAYRLMALALLPRWGGSHAQLMAFVRKCAQSQRFDTEVPYFAIETLRMLAYRDFEEDYPSLKSLKGFNAFPIIRDVLEQYAQQATDPVQKARYESELLVWCWQLDEPAQAAAVWERLNQTFDRRALNEFRGLDDFGQVAIDALLNGTDTLVVQAQEAEAAGHLDQAHTFYQWALDRCSDDVDAKTYLQSKLTQLAWRKALAGGDWVDLTFSPGLAGWTPAGGQWRYVDPQTVEGESERDGLRLFLNVDMQRAFELEADIAFVHSAKPHYFTAGFFLASRDENLNIARAILLVRDRGDLMKIGSSNVPAKVADANVTDHTTLHIKVVDEMVWVWVADQLVYHGLWLVDDSGYEKRQALAIGNYSRFRPGDVLRFSGLRLRKIVDPSDVKPMEE